MKFLKRRKANISIKKKQDEVNDHEDYHSENDRPSYIAHLSPLRNNRKQKHRIDNTDSHTLTTRQSSTSVSSSILRIRKIIIPFVTNKGKKSRRKNSSFGDYLDASFNSHTRSINESFHNRSSITESVNTRCSGHDMTTTSGAICFQIQEEDSSATDVDTNNGNTNHVVFLERIKRQLFSAPNILIINSFLSNIKQSLLDTNDNNYDSENTKKKTLFWTSRTALQIYFIVFLAVTLRKFYILYSIYALVIYKFSTAVYPKWHNFIVDDYEENIKHCLRYIQLWAVYYYKAGESILQGDSARHFFYSMTFLNYKMIGGNNIILSYLKHINKKYYMHAQTLLKEQEESIKISQPQTTT